MGCLPPTGDRDFATIHSRMTDDIFVFLARIYVISIFYKITTCTRICVCCILDSSAMILIKIMFLFINNGVVEYRNNNKSMLLPLL